MVARPALVLLLLAATLLAEEQDGLARDVDGYLAAEKASWWERSTLTGDWGGLRTRLAEKGITLDVALIGVVQGVADGGREDALLPPNRRDDVEALGFLGLLFQVDTEKAGLWPGGFLALRVEGRVGDSVLQQSGTIVPVNTLAILPATNIDEDVIDISAFNFTQFLSEKLGVVLGLINGFDSDYTPFAGATRGQSQFLNLAFAGAPLFVGVPTRALGGALVYLPSERIESILVVESTRETAGRNPFTNLGGITVNNETYFQFALANRPAGAMVGLLLSWDEFTALDQDPRLVVPGGGEPTTEARTWAVYANFFWYLGATEERGWSPLAPADAPGGWGVFFRLMFSDADPDPVRWSTSIGVGGNVSFRPQDTFGIGFFYLGMSNEDIITSLRVDDEFGFEAWYNLALGGFLHLTFDLQVVEPGLPRSDTAVVLALRLHADF